MFLVLFSENGKAEASQGRGWNRDCWSQNHYWAFFPEEARRGQFITFINLNFFFFFLIYKHLLLMRKLVCCWNKNRPVEIQVQTWRGLSKRLMRRSSSWRTKLPGFPEMLWTCFSNMSPLSTTKIYTIRLKMVSSVIFEWIYSSFVSFMDSIFDFELQPWELLCSSLWRRTEYRSFVYCNKFQNKRKPMFFFFFLIMKGLLQWNSK